VDTNSDQSIQLDFLSSSEAPAHTPSSAEPAQTPQAPVTEAQPLVATETQPAPAPMPEQQPEAPRMVPLSELIETRRRAQDAEAMQRQTALQAAQLAETLQRLTQPQQRQQPQPEPIDPELDPGAYIRDLEARMEQRFVNQHLNVSEHNARAKFGTEAVDRALEAVEAQGPAFKQAFVSRPDPYAELVNWHQGQQVRQEIGNPVEYRQKLETELRAKIIAEMRQGTPPPSNLPPSLAGATKANNAPQVVEDASDFFKNTLMNRR
jgi:hypothetical protein